MTFSATAQSGTPTAMVFRTGPSNVGVGAAITPAVVVELRDASGNVSAVNNTVTLTIGSNPGETSLSGTVSRAAVNGVATFDDLAGLDEYQAHPQHQAAAAEIRELVTSRAAIDWQD